jgi:hypothetical protein
LLQCRSNDLYGNTFLTAFDTVAFESRNSAAVSAKERHSASFAKMASPSRSGSLAMIQNSETIGFSSFYF